MAFPVIFLAVLLGGFLFPWWWPALAAYAAAYWLGRGAWKSFLAGFLGTAAAWAALAAFMDWRNGHVLASRMAGLLELPSPYLLLPITGMVGGILGGMGAWAGQSLKAWVVLRRKEDDLGPL